eukprot:15199244-Alexandrium_andersonii.AAC.1
MPFDPEESPTVIATTPKSGCHEVPPALQSNRARALTAPRPSVPPSVRPDAASSRARDQHRSAAERVSGASRSSAPAKPATPQRRARSRSPARAVRGTSVARSSGRRPGQDAAPARKPHARPLTPPRRRSRSSRASRSAAARAAIRGERPQQLARHRSPEGPAARAASAAVCSPTSPAPPSGPSPKQQGSLATPPSAGARQLFAGVDVFSLLEPSQSPSPAAGKLPPA